MSVFSSALSNTQRILLESNQAAYNSVTVSNNKYTPPTSTSYQRFVNGVGRESSADSVAGTKSTVGMGFIIGQTASDFLKDNGDYLTAGINCPINATVSTSNISAPITQRWLNDWYLNKTDIGGNNGTINFYFDFSDYGISILPGVTSNYELLYRSSAAGTFSIVAGTTKSVVGDRVMFAVDASNITTNYYYTIGTINSSASPLPIELLKLDASCENNNVLVSWSTATQSNNDFFTIERTIDGISYDAIGKVKGAGTTSKKMEYAFTDVQPYTGISYYRLRQTDFDGRNKVCKTIEIECVGLNGDIKIYPNPNDGYFTIENAALYADIQIYDITGRMILDQKNHSTKEIIDIRETPNGVYLVKVSDSASFKIVKMVVQR